MTRAVRLALIGLAVSATAAGAQTANPPGTRTIDINDPKQTCHADKVQWALLGPGTAEVLEKARVDSGAETARYLKPDEAVTQEFRYGRLNLTLDENGIVTTASCW